MLYAKAAADAKRPIIVGLFNAQAEDELIRIAERETRSGGTPEKRSPGCGCSGTPRRPRRTSTRPSVHPKATYESRTSRQRRGPPETSSAAADSRPARRLASGSQSVRPDTCRTTTNLVHPGGRRRALVLFVNTAVAVHRRRPVRAARRVRAAAAGRRAAGGRWVRAGTTERSQAGRAGRRACCRCPAWTAGIASARARPSSSSGTATARPRAVGDLHAPRLPGPLGRARTRSSAAPATAASTTPTARSLEGPPPRPLDTIDARIDPADDVGAGAAVKALFDWLHARTGYRDAAHVLLDEPLPPGTGWFFTLGSVLLALLSIQLLTGAFLTLYYAPTPDHAYDSVRFISGLAAGRARPRRFTTTAPASSSSRWRCTCCASSPSDRTSRRAS